MARKIRLVETEKYPVVQAEIESNRDFARHISMAANNGLREDEFPQYYDYYKDNELYGYEGACTMTLGVSWDEHFRVRRENIADMIVLGLNPRIDELPLDMSDAPKNKREKRSMTKKTKKLPQKVKGESVTAAEGDAFRRSVRELCEEGGYELTEKGGAIVVKDDDEDIASASFGRGTKPAAWKAVYDELQILM